MRMIVCDSCEAEFKIKHTMSNTHYRIMYCPFCTGDIEDPEMEDDIEWHEDDS